MFTCLLLSAFVCLLPCICICQSVLSIYHPRVCPLLLHFSNSSRESGHTLVQFFPCILIVGLGRSLPVYLLLCFLISLFNFSSFTSTYEFPFHTSSLHFIYICLHSLSGFPSLWKLLLTCSRYRFPLVISFFPCYSLSLASLSHFPFSYSLPLSIHAWSFSYLLSSRSFLLFHISLSSI